MKRKIILLIIISSLVIGNFAFAQQFNPDEEAAKEPDGFRGIKWLTDISTLSDMEYIRSKDDFEVYIKKGEDLTIGQAKLEAIEYSFWHGKFGKLTILVNGLDNFNKLKDAMTYQYGEGLHVEEGPPFWEWSGYKTVMSLIYQDSGHEPTILGGRLASGQGSFNMDSCELDDQKKQYKEKQMEQYYKEHIEDYKKYMIQEK